MNRKKKHNHKPQKNTWHRKEEPHNHHETPERQTKQSNHPSLPHQDDCETRMDTRGAQYVMKTAQYIPMFYIFTLHNYFHQKACFLAK